MDEEKLEAGVGGDESSEYSAELAMEQIKLFHDQYKEPYALIPDAHKSCVKLSSKQFARWLLHFLLKMTGEAKKISSVIKRLEARALYESPQCDLDVRIVKRDGFIWYDLGNGKAVRIDKSGWEITSEFPIAFRKLKHQKPQVEPLRSGDIKELLKFVNIPTGASMTGSQLLFLVSTVFALMPDHPHPILVLHGPQGSAKTTAFKILKRLIDPSSMGTLSLSDNQRELVQLASHHYLLAFDNLTHLSTDQSDLLCRICTGDGFSKRELYSDDDDVIYSYRRVIGLNGINITPNKADLLDRSLIIGFERVEKFETEEAFWERFETAMPRIFGAMLDTLVKALGKIDSMPEPQNLRMADFGKYGCAIAEAIGATADEFLAAYKENLDSQNDEAISASVVGEAMVGLMKERETWEGTATELLYQLNTTGYELQIDMKVKSWPKDARWVWRRIQEVKTNLEYRGIFVKWHATDSKLITITKTDRYVSNVQNVAPDIMDRMDISLE
jgi:hypothetical protein